MMILVLATQTIRVKVETGSSLAAHARHLDAHQGVMVWDIVLAMVMAKDSGRAVHAVIPLAKDGHHKVGNVSVPMSAVAGMDHSHALRVNKYYAVSMAAAAMGTALTKS